MVLSPSLLTPVVAGGNLLLLGAIGVVWGRNYLTFRNQQVLALLCFTLLLAAENAAALVFHISMGMLYADLPAAMGVAAALRSLQFVALCFLAWATVR